MIFRIRHISSGGGTSSDIISLTAISGRNSITEDITDNNSFIDLDFIKSLKDIVIDLELQNKLRTKEMENE